MIRVFIGYDTREAVAFSVLSSSIQRRASTPVSITPLMFSQFGSIFTRERHPLQSTDFSFSRFLTPFLSEHRGWSLFMDCDMIMFEDISKLWALRDERYAIQVVKHVHIPMESTKFLNEKQTPYEKKNWSSVILFNNEKCRALSPEYVNHASGLELHQFKWLEGDHLIGDLPAHWNHLVGVSAPRKDAAVAHHTLGGPYFNELRQCEYSDEWFEEREKMLYCGQRTAL